MLSLIEALAWWMVEMSMIVDFWVAPMFRCPHDESPCVAEAVVSVEAP